MRTKICDRKIVALCCVFARVWVVGLGGVVLFTRVTLLPCGYCLKASMTGGIAAFRWGMGGWTGGAGTVSHMDNRSRLPM